MCCGTFFNCSNVTTLNKTVTVNLKINKLTKYKGESKNEERIHRKKRAKGGKDYYQPMDSNLDNENGY